MLFITSYHDIKKKVERLRRWPKKTSTNATVVRDIFQDQSRKVLPISGFIDDYNYHMDSVDIADQLRSYYTIQQKCHRNWFPLFYWLLDPSLVNAYRIQKTLNSTGYRKLQSETFTFTLKLQTNVFIQVLRRVRKSQLFLPSTPLMYRSPRLFLLSPPSRNPRSPTSAVLRVPRPQQDRTLDLGQLQSPFHPHQVIPLNIV